MGEGGREGGGSRYGADRIWGGGRGGSWGGRVVRGRCGSWCLEGGADEGKGGMGGAVGGGGLRIWGGVLGGGGGAVMGDLGEG